MIIEAWKPLWGGGQAHVLELAKKLSTNHNCQIDIYTMNLKDENDKTQQRIEKVGNDDNIKIIRTGNTRDFSSLKDRILWIFDVIREIKHSHNKNSYDLIHAQATLPGIPGRILKTLLGVPIIYTVHGTNSFDIKKKNFFYFMEKFLFTVIKYDVQISVSKNILQHKNRNTPVIIPNGVDLDKFKCTGTEKINKKFELLFVGRLDKIKGIDILLVALSKIKKYLIKQNVIIHLVGYGYDEKKIKKQAQELQLEKIVNFKGKVTGSKLINIYCHSDLFILPSLSEGQPLTLLEAWATKLPVIVTDVGDNKYFIKTGINGYIIPPGNPEMLAQTIIKAINNPYLKRMGINGYNSIKNNYTWTQIAKKTYEVYKVTVHK